ncbi:MAG: 30S ribosomal protein S19 [Candidatus Latescibacteria bacterium]|nr:30S ribosomal protein S19 [Candidatus Latescibacterota bacterium]
MGRSTKKGPYIDDKLFNRIKAIAASGERKVIKTYARRSQIPPEFVGHTIAVHTGNRFVPVYITEQMVGHRLGEFASSRTFRVHSGQRRDKKEGEEVK